MCIRNFSAANDRDLQAYALLLCSQACLDTALEAAEKGRNESETDLEASRRAKALVYFVAFAARLKSCPVTKPFPPRVFPQPV